MRRTTWYSNLRGSPGRNACANRTRRITSAVQPGGSALTTSIWKLSDGIVEPASIRSAHGRRENRTSGSERRPLLLEEVGHQLRHRFWLFLGGEAEGALEDVGAGVP